ncbi:MAG: hypothetical protein JXP37_02615 [Coriobacteriia bacterium]|nr:hypothetical protein [Coriobacteriia bacterium]
MAQRRWRTKHVRKAVAAVVFAVLGRGLVAAARLDERVRAEVSSWPDGTVITLRIAPFGPQVSWCVAGSVLEHLGGREADADLLVTFKSVDDALPLLLGMQGVLAAFAEHRATVRGDLSMAMSLVRCLHIVEGYLFPDIMTRRILPHPAERRAGHLTAYVFLVFRTAALEGAAS